MFHAVADTPAPDRRRKLGQDAAHFVVEIAVCKSLVFAVDFDSVAKMFHCCCFFFPQHLKGDSVDYAAGSISMRPNAVNEGSALRRRATRELASWITATA